MVSNRAAEKEAAFVEFASSCQQSLFRQAYLLTGDRAAAEDLVQDTLVRIYVVWRRPGRIDNPRGYASRTMVRHFLTGRERSRREQRSLEGEQPSPGAGGDREDRLTVLAALSALPPRMRAVLVLRFWEDLSVEQTADCLNVSTGTVKSTTSKGLARLRACLGDTFQLQGASQ